MKKHLIYLFILLPMIVLGQSSVMISGSVFRAENNEVLTGATISIKGTARGTITNVLGKYRLNSTSSTGQITLVAKFIGLKDTEQVVILNGENKVVNFVMVSSESQLQDVVVTANKTEEFLQKVGTAATVVSSRDIEQRSSYTTLEALKDAPLLLSDSWVTSHTTFSLRGLSNGIDNIGFENTVGLYLDDVYYSRPFIFNATLFDIDRIEILRGPQGTLFGKNTVGGVINIISEKPEFENSGQAEITAGNYNYQQFRGKWNQVLIKDKLAFRLTGAYSRRNGYIKDLNPKANEFNKAAFVGIKGSLFYAPNKKFDANAKFYIGQDENAEQTLIYSSINEFEDPDLEKRIGVDPLGVKPTGYKDTETNFPQEFSRNQSGGVLKMNYSLGKNKITSISAINSSDDNVLRDLDVTKVDALRWGRKQSLKTISQELRITSPRDKKLSYIGGLYFLNEQIAGIDSVTIRSGILPFASRYFGRNFSNISSNYQETYASHSTINNNSYAAYASASYLLSDKFKVNIGARYTAENRDYTFYQRVNYFNQGGFPVNIVGIYANPIASAAFPFKKDAQDRVLTYDFSIDYKINPYMFSYAKYVKGFKGSGFNTSTTRDISGTNLQFKPEFVDNFELGLKSKFNNRNSLNMAIFYTNYENKQESVDIGTQFILFNAAKTGGWGAEVEYSTMFDKLRVDISGGYLDMKYIDFVAIRDENGNPTLDFSGKKMLKAPNMTISVAPQYSFNYREKYRFILGANINYIGESFNDIHNDVVRVPTTLVNSRVALMPKNGKWSFAIWGKNLLNQSYIQHGWGYITGNVASLNRPLTVGIETYLNF